MLKKCRGLRSWKSKFHTVLKVNFLNISETPTPWYAAYLENTRMSLGMGGIHTLLMDL